MVRVISQGFSTPRSRHSSGEEMIDRFAAMKALSALNDDDNKQLNKSQCSSKTVMLECNTDTNDSFSGADSDYDNSAFLKTRDSQNNNLHPQDHATLKKERRRERNKLSAQSYRQRRRQQYSAAQKTLESLESQHKVLLEKVCHLEAEKHIVEEYLKSCVRIPWCPLHQASTVPCSNNNNTNNNPPSTTNPQGMSPEPSDIPTAGASNSNDLPCGATGGQPHPTLDNFRHHHHSTHEEYRPLNMVSPLGVIVEKDNENNNNNNNMPLCMTTVDENASGSQSSCP